MQLTVVLAPEASKWLVEPDKSREFEYLSLALHSFVSQIKEQDILGWSVEDDAYGEVKEK